MTARRAWLGLAMSGLLMPLTGLPAAAQPALLEVTGQVVQDGKEAQLAIRYQGVRLTELLDRAGLKPGRRDIRRTIVLLTARDGYQASFSWGELYNSALGDGVIVVVRQSNDELLDTDGLPGLRSLQDTRPGPRHVRWLARIEVQLPSER